MTDHCVRGECGVTTSRSCATLAGSSRSQSRRALPRVPVQVELLSVSEWRMNVHVSSEEQVDALADRFGLGPAVGDGFNYQRDAGLFGPLIVYSRRSRSCACGQRCDHGAPPTTKRTAPPTRQEKDMATIVRTQGELDEIDDRGREVVR